MSVESVLDRFAKQAPVCVMVRATLENVLSPERFDAIFERHAVAQRNGELLFSTVADLMAAVVCRIRPSIHAAYSDQAEQISVSVKSLYDKLAGIEPDVSRGMVRETAERMQAIINALGGPRREPLPGHRVKYLDGNHLRRTDRRLGELREIDAPPLPGQALAVLDPQLMLVTDVIPCEDGHAQERSLLPAVLETVRGGEVWVADRNFCTADFLFGIAKRGARFVIREHGNSPSRELIGRRKKAAPTETGVVFEQSMRIFNAAGEARMVRRITIELFEPTRDGEQAIHVLTNLPKSVTATKIARLYGTRWTIETAFQEMAENLKAEINSLGYPKAALFGFCMGLLAYNVFSVVKAAIAAAHGEGTAENCSTYYMADEIASTYRGLMIAVDEDAWSRQYADLSPSRLARGLRSIAKGMRLSRYAKNPWRPKKKAAKKKKKKLKHVATARILEERKLLANSGKC